MITEIKYKSRAEWLAIRKKYIGGSDAAAMLGRSPFRSSYEVWAEKSGLIPGFEGNLNTETGAYLEDFVAHLFERETGKKVRRKNATLVNSKYPWACANVDRFIVGEDAILEIKTTTFAPIMRQLKGTEFPDAYYCQCVHYLAVTGKRRCYLAVLVQNRELKIYSLERDEEEIDALMTAEREFMKLVADGTPPEVDGSESTSNTLSLIYSKEDEGVVDLTGMERDIDSYFELTEAIKSLETQRKECTNRIKAYMQTSGRGESERFSVTYSTSTRSTFDGKRFSADHPEIDLSAYYTTSASRSLRINKINKVS